jgi:hypothetical protein
MSSDAEPEAMAGRINYGNWHMTVGGLVAEYSFTDFDASQPDCWRYLVESETDYSAAHFPGNAT